MVPPSRLQSRCPAVKLTMLIAGIGENDATWSGPYSLIVWIKEAAMISVDSSQSTRRQPALPRACW